MQAGILFGQIAVVLGVALFGVWAATQWTASALGYQGRLGFPWFDLFGTPIYHPWRLFEWWYFFDAYASDVFLRGGIIAASSGLVATGAAIGMAVWRSRLAKRVTTYGSARWAEPEEIRAAGLTQPAGVFLGRLRGPLVFSAITGGTQTQHWRGGGVGRSLILLAFLFTSQTGIVASL